MKCVTRMSAATRRRDEHPPEPGAGYAPLLEAKACQSLLPCENFHSQLAAVLTCFHRILMSSNGIHRMTLSDGFVKGCTP